MEEGPLKGNFTTTPLPQVLFLIWRTEKTGTLTIRKGNAQEKFTFKKGNIVGELNSFPELAFLQSLARKKIIDSPTIDECKANAVKRKASVIAELIEQNHIPPARLWQLMEEFFKEKLFSLFDQQKAEYIFKAEYVPCESQILQEDQTVHLILQGIRQMKNEELIKSHLPQEPEILEAPNPAYINKFGLEPYEKYVLGLVDNSKSLKTIYETSKLGKKMTQRCIFALLMLELVRLLQKKEEKKYFADFSPEEFDKIVRVFNKKLCYIYRYISKETGPVAYNTLSKCLDDIKPQLGPVFQELDLNPDGSIKIKSFLKMNLNLPSDELWKNLIHGLNEILVAEILAVKRTLGNAHEASLVENLKRIGETT